MKRYLLLPWNLLARPLVPPTGPLHVQLEPTDRCNQNCAMCNRDRLIDRPTDLADEGFQKVLDGVRPRKMNLSGLGEPFLHPRIFSYIARARQAGVGVTLATNFTRLQGRVEELIDSGINEVKVSIDAADDETYKQIRPGGGDRRVLLETLEELRRRKAERNTHLPAVRLNFALQAANLDQLVPLIRTARSLGSTSIYVQYLDYVEMEDRKGPLVTGLTENRMRKVLDEAAEACRAEGIASNLDIWRRDLGLYLAKMGPPENYQVSRRVCFFPWISTFIEANGDVKPCPIFVWKRGVGRMGNIYEQDFRSIWRGEPYRELRRELRTGRKSLIPCRQCIPQSLGNIYALFTRLHPGWNRKR